MNGQNESSSSEKESTTPRPRPTSLNAAMTKDLYKNMPAPKPRRTHSTGLSGIVGLITEHLKRSPPPCLRQSSPQTAPFPGIMHPAKHAAFINNVSNRSSSASITEDQRGDSFNPTSVNLGTNSTQSFEGPPSVLAEFCAAPFLGDRKSESGDLNLLFASAVGHRRGGKRIGEYNFTISSSFRRSLSLQGLSSRAALVPCMIPMPVGRPYHDLSDALESIPRHSWILPYVIACTPPEILGQLLDLPFLIEGQSHTHTTATTITRSRAHTVSFDIEPSDTENTTFTVPLNMKNLTLEPDRNQSTAPINNTTPPLGEDWSDSVTPYVVPLRDSFVRESSESPVDDVPVTRARGHTHTGSAYEPDPSLFLPRPPASRSSLSRADDAEFVSMIRMASASPRLGGASRSSSFTQTRNTPSSGGSGKHRVDETSNTPPPPPPPLTAILHATSWSPVTNGTDAFSSTVQLLAPEPIKIPAVATSLMPPSRTPSPTVSAAALGLVAQKVKFPSSWRSLGIVWLSTDPKWNVWHPKIVFLLDNYLLECTAVGTAVIGFTQLSGAIIEKKVFHYNARKQVSPVKRHAPAQNNYSEDDYFNSVAIEDGLDSADTSPLNTVTSTTEDSSSSKNNAAGTGRHGAGRLASYGLKITSFTSSAPVAAAHGNRRRSHTDSADEGSTNTHSYWLTTHDEAALDLIATALQRASTLTFEDVFDVQRLTGEDSLLGQGRFNEVRLARRREDLDLLKNTSVYPSLFTSPQTKSRSTSNAPEYIPPEPAGAVHFDTSKVADPWKLNKSISAASSRESSRHRSAHAVPFQPAQVAANAKLHAVEAQSKKDEHSADACSVVDSSLHGSDMWITSPHTDDSSTYNSAMASSLSSQGPLFAMLQKESSEGSETFAVKPIDRFSVRDPFSLSAHDHVAQSVSGTRIIADRDSDRMSDDVLPAPPPRAAESSFTSHSVYSYGNNSMYISKDPSTHLSDSCHDLLSVSNHGGSLNDDSRFQGAELYKCCAMKLVAKEIFWTRVDEGCERGDALVREVLAQMLVATHFADHPGLTFSSVLQVPPYLNSQDSLSAREPLTGGIALSPVHSVRSFSGGDPFSTHGAGASTPWQGHLPLVQLFSAFETADGFAMELELMQSMDLFDLLAEVGALPEHHVQGIVAQLVEAVSLCNKLGIAHRDIKLSNVCFSLNQCRGASIQRLLASRDCIRVKLADFGMTGFLARDKRLRGRCGTPGYVAPDILSADKNGSYGLNVDMFSIGVVAYTLLCGYEPFYGADNKELLRANKTAEYKFHSPEWDHISPNAKDWISKALQCTAEKRPTPDAARRHNWLKHLFVKTPHAGSAGSGGNSNFSVNSSRHNSDTDPIVVNNPNSVYDNVYNTRADVDNTRLKSCTIS